MLGVRALWRRWDLVEWLVGERDAYAIPEVYVFATREDDSRKAAHVRHVDPEPTGGAAARVRGAYLCVVSELDALASELDEADIELDPLARLPARLLSDLESPLLDPAVN